MKVYCVVCIILLNMIGRATALDAPVVDTGKGYIETSHAGWVWSAMEPYDDSQLSGGSGRAGGPGGYGAYTFNGTGVAVYVMKAPTVDVDGRSHKVGRLKVLIDGNLKAGVSLSSADREYGYRAYVTDGLPVGNHVLQLQPDAGWIVIDGIRVIGGADAPIDGGPADSHDGQSKPISGPTDARQVLFSSKNQPLAYDNAVVFRNNVTGFLSTIGPECVVANLPSDWGPEQIYAHSGNSAIRYSGSSAGDNPYCGMFAYRVHLPVSKNTILTYWILPQQENGRYVGVDLHCTDGTTLSPTTATDQNGVSIHPTTGHGGGIPTYRWSPVQCRIGDTLAGKLVDAIWIVYARNGSSTGQYRGYIDDIVIYNK